MEGELADPSKVNLVGGHINQIRIESEDVLQKKTTLNECVRYLIILGETQDSQASFNDYVKLDATSPETEEMLKQALDHLKKQCRDFWAVSMA